MCDILESFWIKQCANNPLVASVFMGPIVNAYQEYLER